MKSAKNEFTGNISSDCQQQSVPAELITLVNMFLEGRNVTHFTSQNVLTCAQLLLYHFKPRTKYLTRPTENDKVKPNSETICHSKMRETSVVIYNSIKIYATVRSENLINKLYSLGLCMPFKRVLEIGKNMAEYDLKQFDIDKVFIPKHAYKNVFTVLAKYNIDLNASPTTVTNHYHGTSMTMLHFPTINAPGQLYASNFKEQVQTLYDTLKINSVPELYSKLQIPHITVSKDVYFPLSNTNLSIMDSSVLANAINDERLWLQNFESRNHAWSSYHASQKRESINICGVNTILPLIREKVHTLATQYYGMNIISKTIPVINPNQSPVDTCDQPVYTLTNQMQWRYPELFGNSKYFSLFGGLHIEKALLIVHGEFITGSGLDKLLGQSNLSITGMENTVVNVNDIKRCRYGL